MRFLSMIRVDETTGQQPSQRLMDEMMALVGELSAAGVLLDTAGLLPSSHGARVRSQHGRITVTDGPFAEAREVIGGYAVFEAPDRDAALALAAGFVQLHIDNAMPDITVELREIAGGHNI